MDFETGSHFVHGFARMFKPVSNFELEPAPPSPKSQDSGKSRCGECGAVNAVR